MAPRPPAAGLLCFPKAARGGHLRGKTLLACPGAPGPLRSTTQKEGPLPHVLPRQLSVAVPAAAAREEV